MAKCGLTGHYIYLVILKAYPPRQVTLGQFRQHNGSGPPFMFQLPEELSNHIAERVRKLDGFVFSLFDP